MTRYLLMLGLAFLAPLAFDAVDAAPSKQCRDARGRFIKCPVPAPAPTPEPTPVPPAIEPAPAPTLSGEPVIADNFNTALAIQPNPIGIAHDSVDSVGAFRMHCTAGHLAWEDPIVVPGGRSPHLHQFWGNLGTNANSTYKSLRETGKSTCGMADAKMTIPTDYPANRSAYWMPAMMNGVGGVVKPRYINTYYKRLPLDSPNCNQNRTDGKGYGNCIGLPNGIRYVWGFNMATHKGGPADMESPDKHHMFYQCINAGSYSERKGTLAALVGLPQCVIGAEVFMAAGAPDCWDGKNLDSPDHRAHMAYADRTVYNETGGFHACPVTHPYVIPMLSMFTTWTVDANFATWKLDSDRQMNMTPGSTFHWDYWEAWSPSVKVQFQKTCIDIKRSCSNGDLGNGTMLKNAGTPNDSGQQAFPSSVVVPVP